MKEKSSSSERKNLRKNISWLFGGGMGGSVFAMAEVVLLTRFLGLEMFGLFTVVTAYVKILKELLDLKVTEAVVKYVGQCWERKEREKTVSFIKFFYLIDFVTGIVAFLVALLLAEIANSFFIKSDNAFELVFIYSFSLLIGTVNTTSRSVLEVFNKFANVALVEMSAVAVRVAFVAAALIFGFGIKGALLGYAVSAFVYFVVLQFFVNGALKKRGVSAWFGASLKPVYKEIRGAMTFILSSTANSFISKVFNREFPILLLGHFFTAEIAGLYKTATSFTNVIGKLSTPATRAIYPALVSLEERLSYSVFRQLVSYSMRVLAKFFVPVGALFFIFAEQIIEIFFGSEYVPAAKAMRIIVVAEVVLNLGFWINAVLLALGRIWLKTGFTLVAALIYTGALFLLAPIYSFEGAAFARLVFSLTVVPIGIFLFGYIKRREEE